MTWGLAFGLRALVDDPDGTPAVPLADDPDGTPAVPLVADEPGVLLPMADPPGPDPLAADTPVPGPFAFSGGVLAEGVMNWLAVLEEVLEVLAEPLAGRVPGLIAVLGP